MIEPGRLLGRYQVVEELGGGGMGVVYRAVDTRLERPVALKVLRPEVVRDPAAHDRFVREAKAASALQHPHIVTVYDIDRLEVGGEPLDVIAMELVDGEPLDRILARGAMPVRDALALGEQLAAALAAAHAAGLVHRDIKPGNLIVGRDGHLEVVDFGLAKAAPADAADLTGTTVPGVAVTSPGLLVGTPAYMAPEQAEGRPLDARCDVFAAGVVLYEMLAGRRPFTAPSQVGTLLAIVRDTPPPLASLRPEVPPGVARIVGRCLAKDPAHRYPSGRELAQELAAVRAALAPSGIGPALVVQLRRPRVAIPIGLGMALLLAAGSWLAWRAVERRAARREGLPALARLIEQDRQVEAFQRARELRRLLPDDPELERLWLSSSVPAAVLSQPPGARVAVRGYLDDEGPWIELGTTPLREVRMPFAFLRWRLEKEGLAPFEAAPPGEAAAGARIELRFVLPPADAPAGMVRVPPGTVPERSPPTELGGFWIERHEVTNAQFQRFVDDGGYRRRELWQEPWRDEDGRELSWEEAMALFRDATGRPGPATWQLGSFLPGTADHPVGGVSWYEAAAYARWAGGELPTYHHWLRAAQQDVFSEIVLASNFSGLGPEPVGRRAGLGPFGTYDMAGNLHEWCWNEGAPGRRLLAGGAWDEPPYTYAEPSLVAPLERRPSYGLRTVRHDAPPAAALRAPIQLRAARDYGRERPFGDELFAAYRSLYTYDRSELRAEVEPARDSSRDYRRERITFAAAYGGERVPAHLFLPRRGRPPYQLVVYFPSSIAEALGSSETFADRRWWEFLVRSGRAVLYPVYKGTYERRIERERRPTPGMRRDLVIQWSKDLGRALDYVATRRDLAPGKVAYYGFSLGANYAPVLAANEPRLRTLVLLGGGLHGRPMAAEIDPFHFAPRVTQPVLMLNGRDDFIRPAATSQRPLFELLGTPPGSKRHVLFPGGHLPPTMEGIMRETLDWLDRWLGPVG